MKGEVLERLAALMTMAFGLVAALAWNSTIIAAFEEVFGARETVWALLVYAVLVTVLAVFAIIWIARAIAKRQQ